MVSMTNGEMTHEVKEVDVQRFEKAGWAKVRPADKPRAKAKPKPKEA